MSPHPLLLRYLAEDLCRKRRADEDQRYAATQRQGRVDPNPHQIDAVVFALQRIPEGGCILADEVGLGKTIEAGLVIAQLMTEGARRVLVLVPKPLLGQWMDELYEHFSLVAREGRGAADALEGEGIFLLGREWAGSEGGAAALAAAEPFDLCVIDEAHEIFAGIHRRFDKQGRYRSEAGVAVLAHRVREALAGCPMLLLTATPIQNSLAELWGLVQYVEPTGTLLGALPTFRALFTAGADGALFPGQAEDLRRRLQGVVQRTLRRQAEEFLEQPFVRRQARLFEYAMTPEERALYEDVTEYLLTPDLCAFRGAERRLLLLGFHRRMASSVPALARSLRGVADRLAARLDDDPALAEGTLLHDLRADLEEEDEEPELPRAEPLPAPAKGKLQRELERVRSFVGRAEALRGDSKGEALVRAVRLILEQEEQGRGSGKVVVFTESLTTQEHIAALLQREVPLEADAITLFRGTNDSPRALAALERWEEEIGRDLPERRKPGPSIAVRLALVHEFRTRSKIFIATEAGAKGLNLQFCETVVNYDLPWNPQRIEQRIGRCHRYGQARDVTVVNFIASDNEAQRLTFEILARKLDLFGRLLDASDVVLHEPTETAPEILAGAFASEVRTGLARIYERARDAREIEAELAALSERIGRGRTELEQDLRRARGVVESRQDEAVRRAFHAIQDALPPALARFDEDLLRLVTGYLESLGVPSRAEHGEGLILLHVPRHDALPEGLRGGLLAAVGDASTRRDAEVLHLGHPLVQSAVAHARSAGAAPMRVRWHVPADNEGLADLRDRRGRLAMTRLTFGGVEPVERLCVAALLEGGDAPLAEDVARVLLALPAEDASDLDPPAVSAAELDDAIEELRFQVELAVAREEEERFERLVHRIERSVDDRSLILRQHRRELEARRERALERRDAALGADARARAVESLAEAEAALDELAAELERLAERRDESYRRMRELTLARRYGPVTSERLLEVQFALV